MTKFHSLYICQQCGYSQTGWSGKCPECGSWNSLVETVGQSTKNKEQRTSKTKSEPLTLSSIPMKATSRISTKITELDRVLGGGLVLGQVILIAGEPGIGKSTLLLQLINSSGGLYVSGEESASQIKIRADRLGIKNRNIQILEETDIDNILENVESLTTTDKKSLTILIIDSIQTMFTSDLSGMSGSVGQVRECAYRLVRLAKEKNLPVFIVGHVTKQGSVAGPSVLMHIVDTVLWFEGDKSLTFRLLRAVKNRFGPTDEVGIFTMEDKGLISMNDPEKLFLTAGRKTVAGSATTSILEGTRPMMIEIESLVVPTRLAFPKRISQGVDVRRLELLLAVLIRRCGIPLSDYDVFVNIAGGISMKNDPSADLAISLSVASAFFDKPLPKNTIAIGEVGLLGDVREVVQEDKRIKEARRMGYVNIVNSKQARYLFEAIKKYLK